MKRQNLLVDSEKKAASLGLRVRRAAARELRSHPLRYMFRFGACLILAYAIATQPLMRGHFDSVLCWWFLAIFLLLTVARLVAPAFSKGEQVREWAIEQQEHISISTLQGKTQEELEKMLQYHLKYGNIAEADRISQKLLAMVEGDPAATEQPAAVASDKATPGVDKKNARLPQWMKQDQSGGEKETETAKVNLPDWMKQ